MKKNLSVKGIVLITLVLLSSCTTTKLVNSWEASEFESTKSKKILVIARSNDNEVRKAYESRIAKELSSLQINAVESNKIFPNLTGNKKKSKEEIKNILSMFKREGIEAILLTSLKDTKTITKWPTTLKTTDTRASNFNRYRVSFTNFYDVSSNEYLTSSLRPRNSNAIDDPSPALKSTTYLLEALLYDLTLEEKKQLVGGYQVSFEDPESAKLVLNNFIKIIGKQFK